MNIALDATYSLGDNLSGVGIYSREMLFGLAGGHPESEFQFCFRPHRFLRSYSLRTPPNAVRRLLTGAWPSDPDLFHGLNQRLDRRFRRAVSTFHDLFVLTDDYSTPEFRARFAEQARDAARRSDLVIAVSHFTASQVVGLLGVEPGRLRVIWHGARFASPNPPPDSSRKNMILFVGAIQRRKNVARLVEAFRSAPTGWTLVLAGATSGYGAAEAQRTIEASPRRAGIEVLGYVSDQRLRELYSQARIFAFPSLDEGFGMPVLEAMAQGVPVLTSNRSALPEVSGDASLLVDPQDTDSIATGLQSLCRDENLRGELRNRGLKRATNFSWAAAREKTWAVYRELLG